MRRARRAAPAAGRIHPIDRWLDGAVILGSLYTVAMYKFVEGRFTLGTSPLLFPEFLKHLWVARAFTVGFALFFLFYVARTAAEIRRGEASWPRLIFMAATVGLAYAEGYFRQVLNDDGWQGERYPASDPVRPALETMTTKTAT